MHNQNWWRRSHFVMSMEHLWYEMESKQSDHYSAQIAPNHLRGLPGKNQQQINEKASVKAFQFRMKNCLIEQVQNVVNGNISQ
jgi:hypothetical protein